MSERKYFRPVLHAGPARPDHARILAGGWTWFTDVEVLSRGQTPQIIPASDVPRAEMQALTASRATMTGLSMATPRIMGILNTTPDSFSDGGKHAALADAVAAGQRMISAGADILDIGGESTRPGADHVDIAEEIQRTGPVISALRAAGIAAPISIDTRKSQVAEAALDAGADLVNDVSGFTFDAALAPLAVARDAPVCVMHGPVDPKVMQRDPRYDNVVLDVFDFLEEQIINLEAAGIPRSRIIADPGIGFGKTLEHNLALLARLGLFHALGVPILLGASRKRFIGTIGGTEQADARVAGSLGVALAAVAHGIQVLRVHDVDETRQAVALWQAATTGQRS